MKTVLQGHTSQATAYVVDDYPYGFTLRCKMRCWIETSKHGQRLVTQTTNPKKPIEVWNKPKASTYLPIKVMGLDEKGHVTTMGLSYYEDEKKIAEFEAAYGSSLDEYQKKELRMMKIRARASSKVTYEIKTGADAVPQTVDERRQVMGQAMGLAAVELKKEGKI